MEQIIKIVSDIRSNNQIRSFDEATTKQAIILRLLSSLKWDIFDANEVQPEYSVSGKRVDYSLRLNKRESNWLFLQMVYHGGSIYL